MSPIRTIVWSIILFLCCLELAVSSMLIHKAMQRMDGGAEMNIVQPVHKMT